MEIDKSRNLLGASRNKGEYVEEICYSAAFTSIGTSVSAVTSASS